ncbi:hypothetical protein ACT6P6_01965 [Priestia endophytica]
MKSGSSVTKGTGNDLQIEIKSLLDDKGDFREEVAKFLSKNNNLGDDISEIVQVGRDGIDATFLSKGLPPKLTIIESKASDAASFVYSEK